MTSAPAPRMIVAVVACVVIIILVVLEIDIVQHDSEDIATDALDGLFYPRQHGPRKTPMLHDDDGVIDFARRAQTRRLLRASVENRKE